MGNSNENPNKTLAGGILYPQEKALEIPPKTAKTVKIGEVKDAILIPLSENIILKEQEEVLARMKKEKPGQILPSKEIPEEVSKIKKTHQKYTDRYT